MTSSIEHGSLEWEKRRSMLNRRVSHGAIVINNAINVMIDWNEGDIRLVEMLNTNTGE